ncbi:DUF4236 domain-containing protein [Streptacidiphilus sp. EB129]|jgi:hypothetical protein|uniref:DUF4236 domain-containing protein n=1 Tax=Streptacidiphilus sp. EB129 TaxID=3156262 RepID=UPI003519A0DF
MGLSYRESFTAGPFRVTASKSGISYSAGVKGARVTKRANGKVQTTLSAPGTGLRYTTDGSKARARPQRQAAAAAPSPQVRGAATTRYSSRHGVTATLRCPCTARM